MGKARVKQLGKGPNKRKLSPLDKTWKRIKPGAWKKHKKENQQKVRQGRDPNEGKEKRANKRKVVEKANRIYETVPEKYALPPFSEKHFDPSVANKRPKKTRDNANRKVPKEANRKVPKKYMYPLLPLNENYFSPSRRRLEECTEHSGAFPAFFWPPLVILVALTFYIIRRFSRRPSPSKTKSVLICKKQPTEIAWRS